MRSRRRCGCGHRMHGTSILNCCHKVFCSGSWAIEGGSLASCGRITEASDPIMDSGVAGTVARASQSNCRPATANSWFRFLSASSPPGKSDSRKSIAVGMHSNAVKSLVPVKSNSSWKRERSLRGELAPLS